MTAATNARLQEFQKITDKDGLAKFFPPSLRSTLSDALVVTTPLGFHIVVGSENSAKAVANAFGVEKPVMAKVGASNSIVEPLTILERPHDPIPVKRTDHIASWDLAYNVGHREVKPSTPPTAIINASAYSFGVAVTGAQANLFAQVFGCPVLSKDDPRLGESFTRLVYAANHINYN